MRRVLLVLVLLLALAPAQAQQSKPTLVVVLVADQMRADYLTRYSSEFERGLKTLMTRGTWYQNAAYPYFNTVTCPGHTTIGTGTLPFHHGMIGNGWFNRETGKAQTCNEDDGVTEVSYGTLKGSGDSAKWMLRPTLAETMRNTMKSRVATMSIKARSAIGLAGHEGDFVTWLDERGAWTTSSAYAGAPAVWFNTFVQANPINRDADKTWERTLPATRYQYDDDAPFERGSAGWGATFPHNLGPAGAPYLLHWLQSPFADDYLEQMAEAAVNDMHLGQDADRTDFLGVSFSVLDIVGHAYGPRSHEVQDVLVRLDAAIGKLIDFLDKKVGAGKYVLAFSSDHGVADIPEEAPGAGRVNAATVRATIDAAVNTALGGDGPYVVAMAGGDVYFKAGVYDRLKQDKAALGVVMDALMKVPGIARVLKSDDIATSGARTSKDSLIRAAALSYFPDRSGDLTIVPKENWIMAGAGTTHGSGYPYDQRVPVILYGAGIRVGVLQDAITPADIAPTFASILDVRLPSPDGQVLKTALAK
jgi:predicted AlkP superfamily pyrophosphatase or phosphodiesterase